MGVGAVALSWWRWRPFRVAVEGRSMAPELAPGDYLVAVRPIRPRRGHLVVVEHPERPGFEMVKRLAGVPGDVVGGRRLGRDELWVIGDAASASTDSRSFGPVGRGAIRGVVRLRYWPPERLRVFR
ncbi:MAG: nickel-type superoxide dismutase maturation protease [Actinomycetota bacterium]